MTDRVGTRGLIGLATAAGLGAVALGTRAAQPPPTIHDVSDRTMLVTGGNSGIGLETAVALARGGARVLITARDTDRGSAALTEIRQRSGSRQVELVHLDLASLASVEACADAVLQRVGHLDVLVNNAGAAIGERQVTEDGFELTMGANHLAPYLLTRRLLPALQAAPAARVVTVASAAHRRASLDLDDLMLERRPYGPMLAYANSKLANILFARELARRLASTLVTSNSLHPGTVRSGFGRGDQSHWLLGIGVVVAAPLFVGPDRGASTSVHVAADPSLAGVSGRYFSRRRPVRPSVAARNDVLARRLWDLSAQLVGVPRDLSLRTAG